MRKMATIRRIDSIRSIDGADAIECAVVGGWSVVIKKGEFKPGDLAVYCEIDSWIPDELAPFLSKGREPRVFNDVKGERLKTVKLRGQLSQGLLLPIEAAFPGSDRAFWWSQVDVDVSERLNVQKWEAQIPAQLAGQVRGNFPTAIPKTDQERCQNLVKEIKGAHAGSLLFELTEKLEGSSMTCYLINGEFGVCSRNLDLKKDEINSYWSTAITYDIEAKMRAAFDGDDVAIQGELVGPGIQGNIYGLTKPSFYLFDIYNVTKGRYLSPIERIKLTDHMGIPHVPILAIDKDLGTGEVSYILELAEGKTTFNPKAEREGVVFKEMNGGMTFKAISNKYLLGSKD
jgi:RNA ligase (TIGR02306 family)